jgi:hypothetical protein
MKRPKTPKDPPAAVVDPGTLRALIAALKAVAAVLDPGSAQRQAKQRPPSRVGKNART